MSKEKRLVPELRFPGFSGNWNRSIAKDVLQISRGGSPRPILEYLTKKDDGVNWIKIGDTSPTENIIRKTEQKIIKEGIKFSREVFKGDIILSNSMSFGRPYILDIDGCIHDGWLSIKDINRNFVPMFLVELLGSDKVFNQYKRLAAGGVVNNLNKELVQSVKIVHPYLIEQQKIATFLSLIDKKIELLGKKVELLEEHKRGLLQKVFSQEIRFKKDDGSEFEEWRYFCLNEVGEFKSGGNLSKSSVSEKGIRCILYGELYTRYDEVIYSIEQATEDSNLVLAYKNDLLFPTSTTADARSLISPSALQVDEVAIGGDILIFRPKNNISSIYLSYYINSKKSQFAKFAQGITIVHIGRDGLNNVLIPIPDLYEQKKIMLLLSKQDYLINHLKIKVDRMNELKKGLLQKMFI